MTRSEFALWGPDPTDAPADAPRLSETAVGVLEAGLHPEGRRKTRENAAPDSMVRVSLVAEGYTAGEDVSVAVYAGEDRLGRLSAPDSVRWLPVVEVAERAGLVPTARGVVTGDDDDAGLRVLLAEPALALPRNAPPREAHTLLPGGPPVTVRVDDSRADLLHQLIPASDAVAVVLTLHRVHVPGPGPLEFEVEVRMDSRAVGVLDDADAERLLPVVDHFSRRGLTAAVRGIVRHAESAESVVSVTIAAGSVDDLGPRVLNGPPQPVPSFEPRPWAPLGAGASAPTFPGLIETGREPQPGAPGSPTNATVLTGVTVILGGLLVLAAMGAPDGPAMTLTLVAVAVGTLAAGLWWVVSRRRSSRRSGSDRSSSVESTSQEE